MKDLKKFVPIVVCGVLFAIIICWSGWYTVDQGDRAVVLRFGKLSEVTGPGLHFKLPFVDGVEKISVRTRKNTHKINVYSKDIQSAVIVFSINYALNPAKVGDIYGQYGLMFEERIILPQVMAKPKDVFGKYNAVDIVQNREKLTAEILAELEKQFKETGIIAESVQIENIDYSDEYERSVEERMKAEVEVQRVRQNLEREKISAEMVRTKAKGEADARVMAAESEAKAIALHGSAEAEAIKAKSAALSENPAYVKLIEAERWDGALPKTMLPLGTMPILNTTPQ